MAEKEQKKNIKPAMLNMKNFQIAVGATLILQPLEVLQTSMIATGYSKQNINFKGLSLIASQIYNQEGLRGFYRGTILSIAKNTVSFSFFFSGIEKYSPPSHYPIYLQSFLNLMIASSSKLVGTVASTPLAVMRTKMQIVGNYEYSKINKCFLKIAKEEGFFGFYRGTIAAILKDVPFSGIQYTIYRNLLNLSGLFTKGQDPKNNSIIVAICGSSAAMLAIMVTYPFDNLRIRQQAQNKSSNLLKLAKTIKVTEGLKGFYQGYLPRLIKKCIQSGVLWMVYEKLALKQKKKSMDQ
ncbi:unnamed protein product [Paramecium pentaurelia]|uniref:Mitochondrial carrier protein n=1 Tax=Paramecium pentaurelia TaxID=43138 RepID=A0A8S1UWQ6_9CILI|nr:unnamed protein product [Paramecium pentaurelia]